MDHDYISERLRALSTRRRLLRCSALGALSTIVVLGAPGCPAGGQGPAARAPAPRGATPAPPTARSAPRVTWLRPELVRGAFVRYEALARGFRFANAYLAALASLAAYEPQDEASRRLFRAMGFDRVAFVSAGSTQGVVASRGGLLVVAFRGTEIGRWEDLRTDAAFCQVPALGGRVHRGFQGALEGAWPSLLDAVRAQQAASPGSAVVVTGHSLGGALAVLAAARLEAAGVPVGAVYTFGQPKVGDAAFAAAHPARERIHRVVMHGDPVALVPVRYQWRLLRGLERRCPLRYVHVGIARLLRPGPEGRYGVEVVDPARPAGRLVRAGRVRGAARSLGEAFGRMGAVFTVARHLLGGYLVGVLQQLGPAPPAGFPAPPMRPSRQPPGR